MSFDYQDLMANPRHVSLGDEKVITGGDFWIDNSNYRLFEMTQELFIK